MAGAYGSSGLASVLSPKVQQAGPSSVKACLTSRSNFRYGFSDVQIARRAGLVPQKRLEYRASSDCVGMLKPLGFVSPVSLLSCKASFTRKVSVIHAYERAGRERRLTGRLKVSCNARGPVDALEAKKKVVVQVMEKEMVLSPRTERAVTLKRSTELKESVHVGASDTFRGELKERVAALDEVYEELSSGFSEKDPQNVVRSEVIGSSAGTLYLVDVHPLCYEGKRPRPRAILKWMKLLFNQVTREDPVIAVMDGEKGNDYRRHLLPGYKAKRNKYKPLSGVRGPYYKGDEMDLREAFPLIQKFLVQCNVPVLKVEDAEADDVIATLMHQAVSKGMRVVVASPDMDFRQLISENVNMLLPLPEFGRWSFYTLEQYVAQNSCDPGLDLGLRCILGDSSDNVPGLPELAPGFGRKTALKLMKKHGSLESLLVAAKTRTVGRPYIQEALTQHADILYRNLQVLKLRRDLDIILKEEWCKRRDRSSEVQAFQMLEKNLLRTTVS